MSSHIQGTIRPWMAAGNSGLVLHLLVEWDTGAHSTCMSLSHGIARAVQFNCINGVNSVSCTTSSIANLLGNLATRCMLLPVPEQ